MHLVLFIIVVAALAWPSGKEGGGTRIGNTLGLIAVGYVVWLIVDAGVVPTSHPLFAP